MRTSVSSSTYTRVAVVQLAYHPAIVAGGRVPIEEPLFDPKAPDALLPSREEVPVALLSKLEGLRARIRRAYDDQVLLRVKAVLAQCAAWGARIVVFPEYSIPWEILGGVADAAGEMVVVAGTHTVDRAARRSGIYERLVASAVPAVGQAVCPVLHRGRLLGLQPKLSPATAEQRSMRPGDAWAPVEMPAGVTGPMGVLVCLDFLFREGAQHRALVAERLEECRFLAVPSLTPHYTLPEFSGKAWEEARRYGRPVLYADGATGGGTSVYVDEGQVYDLRRFPEHAGYLETGDEGVIVADVDLGYRRPGGSTRYSEARPVVPVAEATLVYRAHPVGEAYARWLDETKELLARDDDDALDALFERVEGARGMLLDAGALSGAAARGRRLRRLDAQLQRMTSVEQIRELTREVIVPAEALPFADLRATMAGAAADVMFEWLKDREARLAGFAEVEERLRKAGEARRREAEWTSEGTAALGAVAQAVRGEPEVEETPEAASPSLPEVRVVLPEGVDPAALGTRAFGGWVLSFRRRPADFRTRVTDELRARPSMAAGLQRMVADLQSEDGLLRFSEQHILDAETLFLLAVAEGAEQVVAVGAWPEGSASFRTILVASLRDGQWRLWTDGGDRTVEIHRDALGEAVSEAGLRPAAFEAIPSDALSDRVGTLLPTFVGAAATIAELREQRLREVAGKFVEPDVRVNGGEREPMFGALDQWLYSGEQTALVLGEFGSGKSTALAEWAHRRWGSGGIPRVVLVSLAGAGAASTAEELLLRATGTGESPANRAALRLLVRHRRIVPCFDGFDEMATRIESAELAGRLAGLLEIAHGGGKVIVSSRDNYFPSEAHLATTTESALAQALGASAGLRRLTLQPFTDAQIRELVREIRGKGPAEEALRRIAGIYDLSDLVHRPLLLGMVLATLDKLSSGAKIGRADLYEAYLDRWLDNTRSEDPECFTDDQKKEFAEALAEQLWRSGSSACSWSELQRTVRVRLAPLLPENMQVGAAFLEIQGGAFFVHEGEDRYRFAHKSFLEYFLARALVATLPAQPQRALQTRPLTGEVAAFVGEIAMRSGEPSQAAPVKAAQLVLTQGQGLFHAPAAGADERGEPLSSPVANAFRLLFGLSRWAGSPAGWIPERADLRGVVLSGEDLRGAMLVGARLERANLCGADLSGADLTGAALSGARLTGARLDRAVLCEVVASGADFRQAEANGARVDGADFSGALLQQSTWTACSWIAARPEGADVTGCVGGGPGPAFPGLRALRMVPPAAVASLATGHRSSVRSVAWHPDGTRLASAGGDGTVRVWEAATGKELSRLEGHANGVRAVAWHPDGTRLASAGDDGTVRVWEAATGKELSRLEGHANGVQAVAWHPGGTRLASAGVDRTVRVWEAATGKELSRLEGHGNRVFAVAWHPDGTRLASAGVDGMVRVWEAATGKELSRLEGHANRVFAVAWHPDGTRLASAGVDGMVRVWEAATGKELSRLKGHANWVWAVAWHPDGTHLASAGVDRTVRVWEAATGKELSRLEGHANGVQAVAWHPGGTRLASAGYDRTVRVWEAATGKELSRLEGHANGVQAVAWHPDGTRLASAGVDGMVRVWEAATGKELSRLEGHANGVWAVAWHPDGTRLASAGNDRTVRLWEATTGNELSQLAGHANGVWAVAWHPDGMRFASAGNDGTVQVWEAATGKELSRLEGHASGVQAVAWHPDGTRLASAGNDGTVRVWEAATGKEQSRLEGHANGVWAVAWHPDGTRLASAGKDGTVRVWEAATGKEQSRLEGHGDWVQAVAWHPDGTRLASAGNDGTVRVWEAATGKEQSRLKGHANGVWAVAWHPDGTRLASTGEDGTVRVWRAAPVALLATFEAAGPATLCRTPGGFCLFDNTEPHRVHLALRRPESHTVLYAPLAGLRDILHRPDKIAAALSGDLRGDDLQTELTKHGYMAGEPWDGNAQRIAPRAAPGTLSGGVTAPSPASEHHNPFIPGRALTDSGARPGRDPVIVELLALVDNRSPAVLRGPRRSGKTSLLHHLAARLRPTRAVHHRTLEGSAAPLRTADDLAIFLDPSLRDDPTPSLTLRTRLASSGNAVLLLDEVAHLQSAEPPLFAWLRAVGQEQTSVVLVGSHWDWVRIVEHAAKAPGSSFGNDVTPINLGPIAEADAVRFLEETAPPDVPLKPDTTARWIVDRCGPWPFYLQVMGYAVVQAVRSGHRRALVEREGVTDLYEQRLLLDRDAAFFGTRWAELPERARRVLWTLRRAPGAELPPYRDLPAADQRAVRDTGLCNAFGHWLQDKPFYDWIKRVAPDDEEESR